MAEERDRTATARLVPGRGDRAILELREDAPGSGWGTNIVLTMAERRIIAMDEQRHDRKARRMADVG